MVPELIRDEVDGVPAFIIPSGRPLLSASLIFRAGMSDEWFASSGWLHLLEHMALHASFPAHVRVNGSVGPLFTSLDIEGEPADVARFLTQIARSITHIDPERVAHETRVLRAEAAQRQLGALPQSFLWRFGASGPGLVGYSEPGLGTATVPALQRLASSAFARGNACLALSGPVPAGLRLDLPAGARWAAPTLIECAQPRPATYVHDSPSVIMTGLLTRSPAALMLTQLLTARIVDQLRHAEGITYSPGGTYQVLGNQALAGTWAEVADEHLGRAIPLMLQAVEDLATLGPRSDELQEHKRSGLQRIDDPYSQAGRAWGAAHEWLLNRPEYPWDVQRGDLEHLSPVSVAMAARQLQASMLVGIPGSASLDSALPVLLLGPKDAPLGSPARVHRPRPGTFRNRAAEEITVTSTALQRRSADNVITVPLQNLAGVLCWPDGARQLVRHDGYLVHLEPTLWRNGQKLTAWVDQHVPPDLALPQPERESQRIPKPATVLQRVGSIPDHKWFGLVFVALFTISMSLLLGSSTIAGIGNEVGINPVVIAVGCWALYTVATRE